MLTDERIYELWQESLKNELQLFSYVGFARAVEVEVLEEAAKACEKYAGANVENDNMCSAFLHCAASIRALAKENE